MTTFWTYKGRWVFRCLWIKFVTSRVSSGDKINRKEELQGVELHDWGRSRGFVLFRFVRCYRWSSLENHGTMAQCNGLAGLHTAYWMVTLGANRRLFHVSCSCLMFHVWRLTGRMKSCIALVIRSSEVNEFIVYYPSDFFITRDSESADSCVSSLSLEPCAVL